MTTSTAPVDDVVDLLRQLRLPPCAATPPMCSPPGRRNGGNPPKRSERCLRRKLAGRTVIDRSRQRVVV
jgi:hypothetical protein